MTDRIDKLNGRRRQMLEERNAFAEGNEDITGSLECRRCDLAAAVARKQVGTCAPCASGHAKAPPKGF